MYQVGCPERLMRIRNPCDRYAMRESVCMKGESICPWW
nr:MAG TPA: hypothetical protein [Caudoviricetes sp.]